MEQFPDFCIIKALQHVCLGHTDNIPAFGHAYIA